MTRKNTNTPTPPSKIAGLKPTKKANGRVRFQPHGYWRLQDAKARFSELVRCVRSEGPQHVTIHGREEVVVVAAEEFRRLKGTPSGAFLVAAMQSMPHAIDFESGRTVMPVRAVDL
jgi:prevent-host-death family protein